MDTIARLCRAASAPLAAHLLSPDWRDPDIGIVHLGIGNFHRAHEAVYTEEAMLAAGGEWGICGVTLQGDVSKRDTLMAQDGLYSLVERSRDGTRVTVIRSLREVLAMPHDRSRLFALLGTPAVRIVSLTVTEKGYCRDTRTGDVDFTHAGIRHDLDHPDEPITVPGILAYALSMRRRAGIEPFTVLSCDNLSHNGAALKRAVLSYAAANDPELADWIDARVAFPATMVDRIVPSTSDVDRDAVRQALGLRDDAPVPCEPFRQWVVEDTFPAGRPAWERAGAQMVDDVAPFENAKLRMLNGTHSAIAYLSMLAGFVTVDEAIAHPPLRKLIHAMMTIDIAPTLSVPASFDLLAYRDALLERYANPALKHRCAQIAMDGSQKIPPRLLATISARLDSGMPINRLALAVGAWLVFLRGRADDGTRYEIHDPLGEQLVNLATRAGDRADALVDTLLGCRDVFPPDLGGRAEFRRPLIEAVTLLQHGARAAIDAVLTRD